MCNTCSANDNFQLLKLCPAVIQSVMVFFSAMVRFGCGDTGILFNLSVINRPITYLPPPSSNPLLQIAKVLTGYTIKNHQTGPSGKNPKKYGENPVAVNRIAAHFYTYYIT
jgi:hypothetical protein